MIIYNVYTEITQRQATSDGIGVGGIAGIAITLIVIIAIVIVMVIVVMVIFRLDMVYETIIIFHVFPYNWFCRRRSGKHLQYSPEREMNTRVYVKQNRIDETAVVYNTSEVAPKEEATCKFCISFGFCLFVCIVENSLNDDRPS